MQNNIFFEESNTNNVIVIEEVLSTNDFYKNFVSNTKPPEPFTAIMANHQKAGKGQRGNVWHSARGENLTASFLLNPVKLNIQDQFVITMISSLALKDVISTLSAKQVQIKWPNDMLIDGKKIAGILIENIISGQSIKHAIVGIGLNIFQKDFGVDLQDKTTSIILQNPGFDKIIHNIAQDIQQKLKDYTSLASTNLQELISLYNESLFQRDTLASYSISGEPVQGKILKVDLDGLLQIQIDGELRKIDLKGISYKL